MSKSKNALTEVLEAVSIETDVAVSKIMSRCSDAETVDARWMCVKVLSEAGYYPSKIAGLMAITPRYVQYILTDFECRLSANKIMRTNYERVGKLLRTKRETTI